MTRDREKTNKTKKNFFLCTKFPINICKINITIVMITSPTEDGIIKFMCIALHIEPHELKDGLIIERDMLLSKEKYECLKPHVVELKKIFSSKCMTSMHASAECNQKWPCLNLVRQVLKRIGYDIEPERRCAGRDETGKKIFERFFRLSKREKMDTTTTDELTSPL